MNRALAALLLASVLGWPAPALALDRERAIATAKTAMGGKCAATDACTFDATRVEGKWRVRVDVGKSGTAKKPAAKSAPDIFLINDAGRIVGRVGR